MMVLVVVEYDGKHAEVLEVVYTGVEDLEVGCMGTNDKNQE